MWPMEKYDSVLDSIWTITVLELSCDFARAAYYHVIAAVNLIKILQDQLNGMCSR